MGRKTLATLVLVGGVLVLTFGVTAVWFYVSDGVIASMSRPDKSYIFWLIPIAFIGVVASVAGSSCCWVAAVCGEATRQARIDLR